MSCNVCGISSDSKCAKCNLTCYCSREHQIADWPTHKRLCRSSANLKSIFDAFTAKILINILVMSRANSSDKITIDIPETLDQFIMSNFHFIHISCDEHDSVETTNKKITIVYKAMDYHYDLVIDQPDNVLSPILQEIKPGKEWSILVE